MYSGDPPVADVLRDVRGQIVDLPLAAIGQLAGSTERIDGVASCQFESNIASDIASLNANATVDLPAVAIRNTALKQIHATSGKWHDRPGREHG